MKLRTTRPGVTLRTRRGFAPLTAAQAARDRLEMALITPDAAGDFAVAVRTDAPKKGGGMGRRLVPFAVVVPVSALTFLDEGGKKKAVVEIGLAAVEDTGARSAPVTQRQEIVVTPEVLAASGEGALRLPRRVQVAEPATCGSWRPCGTSPRTASESGSTSVRVE